MSTPDGPADFLLVFLDCIGRTSNQLAGPLADVAAVSGRTGSHAVPVRLLGRLAQLTEDEGRITSRISQRRATLIQDCKSRGGDLTLFDSHEAELYREEETERSQLRERWYSDLPPEQKTDFDSLCLGMAESVIRPCVPLEAPDCLWGPLARLALEHSAINWRYDARFKQKQQSLAHRRQNITVAATILEGLTKQKHEAGKRLIGRWFRELTPAQCAAFDAIIAGKVTTPTPLAKGQEDDVPKGPGRPPKLSKADYELRDDWHRARDASVEKKDFVKDKGTSVKALDRALDRCYQADKNPPKKVSQG